MALETVVFQQDPFTTTLGGVLFPWGHGYEEMANHHETLDTSITGSDFNPNNNQNTNSHSQPIHYACNGTGGNTAGRSRRRRRRSIKDEAEAEYQRMTHITVERNRRKQMNDYLAAVRSMMPPSYAQRADQASIIGGAINFLKELEKLLLSLEAHEQIKKAQSASDSNSSSDLFSNFFSCPQYSTSSTNKHGKNYSSSILSSDSVLIDKQSKAIADVEVTMVEGHANLKILSRRQPELLLKMVAGLHSLCLNILHLHITTVDHMVLYSLCVKVENECKLTSVDEIAAAVYKMVGGIPEDVINTCIN